MATVSFLRPAKPEEVFQGREVANDPYKLFSISQKVKRAKMCIDLQPSKALPCRMVLGDAVRLAGNKTSHFILLAIF